MMGCELPEILHRIIDKVLANFEWMGAMTPKGLPEKRIPHILIWIFAKLHQDNRICLDTYPISSSSYSHDILTYTPVAK